MKTQNKCPDNMPLSPGRRAALYGVLTAAAPRILAVFFPPITLEAS